MELIKEIVFDRDSEKIVNWADFIYELVKEKKSRREFKIELILAGEGNREFEIELNQIRGLIGETKQSGVKTLYINGEFSIKTINLFVNGDKIKSGKSLVSCSGWVSDIIKDPNLKISIENLESNSVNKKSFIINI